MIVLGDFNICLLNKEKRIYDTNMSVLNMFGSEQIIDEQTRLSQRTSSLIDHILCNNKEKIVQSGTISLGLSDHNLILYTRKISRGQINKHNTVKTRSMKNYKHRLGTVYGCRAYSVWELEYFQRSFYENSRQISTCKRNKAETKNRALDESRDTRCKKRLLQRCIHHF